MLRGSYQSRSPSWLSVFEVYDSLTYGLVHTITATDASSPPRGFVTWGSVLGRWCRMEKKDSIAELWWATEAIYTEPLGGNPPGIAGTAHVTSNWQLKTRWLEVRGTEVAQTYAASCRGWNQAEQGDKWHSDTCIIQSTIPCIGVGSMFLWRMSRWNQSLGFGWHESSGRLEGITRQPPILYPSTAQARTPKKLRFF